MNIQNIKITNFKAIEYKEYSFDKHLNVLIGDNAQGKTTILEALSFVLGTFFLGVDGVKTPSLKAEQKRRKIISADNIEIVMPFKIEVQHTFNGESYSWFRDTNKKQGNATTYKNAKIFIDKVKELDTKLSDENSDNHINLPLISYYGTDRTKDRSKHKDKNSRIDGYYGALDEETVTKQFEKWFRDYEDSVLKFGKDKSLYNAFTNAITSMVSDYEKIHYSWEAKDILGKLKNGNWIPLSMLSSGYQSIVRLTADIAYRAIKLNPHLGEKAVLNTDGVVLIDEIDMHLHPKWQKTIIKDLKKTFPKIQFIITTHSPFIIQSLRVNEVINLDAQTLEDPFNKSIEDIVESEMNVENVRRSVLFLEMQKLAKEYFGLIKDGKDSLSNSQTRDLKTKLDEIEEEFSQDPVFVALMKAERASN